MLNRGWQDLSARVAAEADLPVASDISRVGDVVRQRHRGAAAILAYGSCIRGVSTSDSLIDLYVLVRHPGDVSNHPLLRLACRWLPPNVHFLALEEGGRKVTVQVRHLAPGRFPPSDDFQESILLGTVCAACPAAALGR